MSEIEDKTEMSTESVNKTTEKKFSWSKLRRVESLDIEAGKFSLTNENTSQLHWWSLLKLSIQCVGVVYGDLGSSPLYTFPGAFAGGIKHKDDVIGVLSLLIYTICLIPLIKYVFIVIRANDNGDGGTFALYSLISKHAKVSLIPNDQPEDQKLSNYRLETLSNRRSIRTQKIRQKLENSYSFKIILFLLTILGTSMVIGDGILTPSVTVLSAVSGINSLGTGVVVGISVAILIALFSVQQFGTDKVGYSFAPILCTWFAVITGIGLYNLCTHGWGVMRALNPLYIVTFFSRNGKQAWLSLGGVILCTTGSEAMFADLGHFSVRAIQISFSSIVFPAILAIYSGQAAYLYKYPEDVKDTFYKSTPHAVYWPTFVLAVASAIVASQSLISGAFSIVQQSLSLGCFPSVKVIHTSEKFKGQVYIPEVNYLLMISCVLICVFFQTTEKISNAYGIAVIAVMLITTIMITLTMLVVWKTNILLVALFLTVYGCYELLLFSSVLVKFIEGGYLPIAFSFVLMIVMATWHYVSKERYMFELKNKVPRDHVRELVSKPEVNRIPGIGFLYSELVQGIPPIFPHFLSNIPSIHSVLVFVSIKSFPFSKVELDERFLFRKVEPKEYSIFCCIVRLGYNDVLGTPEEFEQQLVQSLKDFIVNEHLISKGAGTEQTNEAHNPEDSLSMIEMANDSAIQGFEEEIEFVQKQMEKGMVHLLGQAEVIAKKDSSLFKKLVVNHGYKFLMSNVRQTGRLDGIPHSRHLRIGMTYEI